MKKRIVAFLSLLFIVFTLGSAISMLYITLTTTELKKIITLHSIEIMRQDLIIKIQNVEQDLLTVHTELGRRLDTIVENVTDLDQAINRCAGCHHSPLVTKKLGEIVSYVNKFETSLSYYITAAADEERIRALKSESYGIATELLNVTTEMAMIANQRLKDRTEKAIDDVTSAQRILIITLFISFLIGLWIAVNLTRNIISPVRELISVSRKIASGDLGCTTDYTDSTEFGELAASINEMSISLRESNRKIMQHMNRLAGLYRVTVPFHSVSDVEEIYKEVSYGVAELINVEQCGLLLLDDEGRYLEHKSPAFGLTGEAIADIRVTIDEVLKLYAAHSRRPIIVNDPGTEDVPPALLGPSSAAVRNMLLGWVRHEGSVTGIIRLANKKEGEFSEESARLIAIISNNISVAIENARLYEDLKAQMLELRQTQEQLVQAAKLAAIGELASNVAHEINNPLTSIMGYAELIKEESDNETIMRDLEIIEKESMRARDIVQQLLEFARRRPLEIRELDLNGLLREVITLACIQIKDSRIRIVERYADLPSIMGDQNQLKQVFINLLNNAVHALEGPETPAADAPPRPKDITITTGRKDSTVFVEIADTGHGIPADVIPKIFEPFFTTKREKGTGLGLSITYKIIESHGGRIDVRSQEGTGTRFTIILPIYVADRQYAHPAR